MLIDRLHYDLGLNTAGLRRGEAQANRILGRMDSRITMFGAAWPALLGGALGYIGLQAVNMSKQFEQSLAEIGTLVNKSADDIRDIGDEILDLTTRIPQTAEQLMKGYYQTISSGVSDAAEAMYVLEVASKAAVGGVSQTSIAVDAITNVLNAYNVEATEASKISDILFTAIKEGKLTMDTLAPSVGTVVSSAALAGVKFEEVAAGMAAMTKAGYSADESATALNRLFMSIVDTQDDARKAAKQLGIEWSVSSMQAKGFYQFMQDLNEAAGDNIERMQAINPEVRAFRAAAVLAGTGAEEFSRILGEMEKAAGAAEEAFRTMSETVQNQTQLAINNINKHLTELGLKILPMVAQGLDDLNIILGGTGTKIDLLERQFNRLDDSSANYSKRVIVLKNALEAYDDITAKIKEKSEIYGKEDLIVKSLVGNRQRLVRLLQQQNMLNDDAARMQLDSVEFAGKEWQQRQFLVEALKTEISYLEGIVKTEKDAADEAERRAKAIEDETDALDDQVNTFNKLSSLSLEVKWPKKLDHIPEWGLPEIRSEYTEPKLAEKIMAALHTETEISQLKKKISDIEDEINKKKEKGIEISKKELKLAQERIDLINDLIRSHEIVLDRQKRTVSETRISRARPKDTSGLPYSYMDVPPPTVIDTSVSLFENLWVALASGESTLGDWLNTGEKFISVLSGGDRELAAFTRNIGDLIFAFASGNIAGTIGAFVNILGDLFGSTKSASEAQAEYNKRLEEFTEQVEKATWAQLALMSGYETGGYLDIVNEGLKNWGKFSDDWAGVIARWNYEVELLDIEDPSKKLELFRKIFKEVFGFELPTDISDVNFNRFIEALDAGESFMNAFYEAFGFMPPAGMTETEMRDFISIWEELLDDLEKTGESIAKREETIALTRTKEITYRQANELVTAAWSMDLRLEQIYTLLNSKSFMIENLLAGVEKTAPKIGIEEAQTFETFAHVINVNAETARITIDRADVHIAGDTLTAAAGLSETLNVDAVVKSRTDGVI